MTVMKSQPAHLQTPQQRTTKTRVRTHRGSVVKLHDDFRRIKPLSEILGDAKPIESLDELFPESPVWESEEEFADFMSVVSANRSGDAARVVE